MRVTRLRILFVLLVGALGTWLGMLVWAHSLRIPENYTLIEDGLYLGGNENEPPPGTSAVLNLCEMEDPYRCEFHVWDSIRDGRPAPSLDWLNEKVAFVEKHRSAGRTTFVHCYQGVSRSGMVVAAYLMKQHGLKLDDALSRIRKKRPGVRPNAAFMELLRAWERELKLE
jgi:hypothetical protein